MFYLRYVNEKTKEVTLKAGTQNINDISTNSKERTLESGRTTDIRLNYQIARQG